MRSFSRHALAVLATGAIIVTLSLGVRAAFGVFLKPISSDLGLGREVFSFALALQTLLTGIGGPIVGALGDRYGAMRITAFGGLFLVLGLATAPLVATAVGLQITFGLLVGLGMTAASMGLVMGAVARAVSPQQRSLAFGIIMAGGSFGQFLLIPFAQQMINAWDWRVACQLLAVLAAAILPLALGLRGDRASSGAAPAAGALTLSAAFSEAVRHSGFWLLTASFFVCGFHVSFIQTHLPAYLSDRGMSGNVAAQALAFVGLFNIFGSFASGWLGGRFRHRYLLVAIYLLRALLFVPLLLLPMTPALALTFSALMGLLYLSTVAPTSGIVAGLFGPRHFSMLYGIVFGSHQLGGFIGAWLGGYLFDRTGSYRAMWWLSIALGVAAAALAAPIRDKPVERLVPAGA